MSPSLTVLVADDHVGLATALSEALRKWFLVEPPVNSIPQLEAALSRPPRPRVVLLDLAFGDANALRCLPDLVAACPEVAFVILSASWSEILVDRALQKGAAGYLCKGVGLTELRQATQAAAAGRVAVYGPDGEACAGRGKQLICPKDPLRLKQRRLLGLLKQGHPRAEIARRLGISVAGVDAATRRLRRAFGLAPGQRVDWGLLAPD